MSKATMYYIVHMPGPIMCNIDSITILALRSIMQCYVFKKVYRY